MRCPKCFFVSFDHRAACSKCGTDTVELSKKLNGTAIDAETPFFLASAIETVGGNGGEAAADVGIGSPSFSQTDVDFQLEPDFDLSGNESAEEEGGAVDFELESDSGADISFDAEPAVAEEVDLSFDAEPAVAEEVDLSFDAEPAVAEEVDLSFDAEPAVAEEVDLSFEGGAKPDTERVAGVAGVVDEERAAGQTGDDFDFDDDILSDLDLAGLEDMDFESSGDDGVAGVGDDDAYEDLFGELDLFDDDKDPEPSMVAPSREDSGLSLELDQEKSTTPKKAVSLSKKPDIPDLGLSLERDE